MQRSLKALQGLVDAAREDSDVLAVLLFGSHARGDFDTGSDVDVCLVLAHTPYDTLTLSHKKLEYLGQFDVDVQVFQQLPLYVRQRVLKDGQVIFVRDEDALYDIALETVRAFEDFRHFYRDYLEEVARVGP